MTHFTTLGTGDVPILLHLPHNSTHLPAEFEWNLDASTLNREIYRLVDHHTEALFQPIMDAGAYALRNDLCRLFFDPERFADPKKESMYDIGMGVFYTQTTEGVSFRPEDTTESYEQKIERYYNPYHNQFTNLVQGLLTRHGTVLIIDGHSYPKASLPYEQHPDAPRPQIDIGTWTGSENHTFKSLIRITERTFKQAGYTVEFNTPFKGSILPTPFIGDERVQTMMLEIRRDVYLDDKSQVTKQPVIHPQRLKMFHTVLRTWIQHHMG